MRHFINNPCSHFDMSHSTRTSIQFFTQKNKQTKKIKKEKEKEKEALIALSFPHPHT